ncbi:glycosyltransferase [Rhizobium deserti]|uniref:Glycosyltransferase n=1 Tax=Rhizobium deserti TaxID=2547961 RepID=A0A4R5UN27_9HYPH|nr:glycosyltransferase [Rhizobium deserti]TDK39134.1 glycosyltransferase [Rhizobium deserti]
MLVRYFVTFLRSWFAKLENGKRESASGSKKFRTRVYQAIAESGEFNRDFYNQQYPDVARSKIDPLRHYIRYGAGEGRNPSARFDTQFYMSANPDVASSGLNPLFHYVVHGKIEGRSAAPAGTSSLTEAALFDEPFYLSTYPDIAAAGVDPFRHYLTSGHWEGRNPNKFFSSAWYSALNRDSISAGQNPLKHYHEFGWREGRDPHPNFSVREYLAHYPDVAQAGIDPLVHYLRSGEKEGRQAFASTLAPPASELYYRSGELLASSVTRLREDGLRGLEKNFGFVPLNVVVDPVSIRDPALLILLPGLNRRYATGGPNTAYILGCLLAAEGVPVKFVSVDAPADQDLGPLKEHLLKLTGLKPDDLGIEFLDAHARDLPITLNYNDILLATAWWTAQPAKAAHSLLRSPRFAYLIQDYESMFYGLSVLHAFADETYGYNHIPVVNTKLLLDHLVDEKVGRFADASFAKSALCFDPAVDSEHFYPAKNSKRTTRRLLFYTRPTMAERNLFWLGVASLKAAVLAGAFGDSGWEFIGMGENFDPIQLGRGYVLKPAEWMDFAGYAQLMRESDLLLSLMLSPHPSYPPLEFAACGGVVITTTYGSKTPERLAELSPNIIAVPATLDELVPAIVKGRLRYDNQSEAPAMVPLPTSWVESLSEVIPGLISELEKDGLTRKARLVKVEGDSPVPNEVPSPTYSLLNKLFMDRARRYTASEDTMTVSAVIQIAGPGELDVVLPAFSSQSRDLVELVIQVPEKYRSKAQSYVASRSHGAEPRILSRDASMREIAAATTADYIVFVGPDGTVSQDAFAVARAFAEQTGSPSLIVADGYNVSGSSGSFDPLMRTGWDPVIAHFGGFVPGFIAVGRKLVESSPEDFKNVGQILADGDNIHQSVHLPEQLWLSFKGLVQNTAQVRRPSWIIPVEIQLAEVIERDQLLAAIAETSSEIVALIGKSTAIGTPDYASVSRVFEQFPDTVMVGGRVSCSSDKLGRGIVFGYDGLFGDPHNNSIDLPYTVNAVSARLGWVKVSHLREALKDMPKSFGIDLLGLWLGVYASETRNRIVYLPSYKAEVTSTDADLSNADMLHLGRRLRSSDYRARGYAPNLNFSSKRTYEIQAGSYATPAGVAYAEMPVVDSEIEVRRDAPSFGILTTVYIRTDASLFRETAGCVMAQLDELAEWVVLANGPVTPEVEGVLRDIGSHASVRVLRCPVNLGIHGGTRRCLDEASAEYLMVLDADDLLVPGSAALVRNAISEAGNARIFYTDEDLLIGGRAVHPFYRPDYDPAHLRAHSFIWHAIIFHRPTALELGTFTNGDAEYAQDWDNLLRFELAGHHPVHIPSVVYHWRQHTNSLSNSGSTFEGSIRSVRNSLEMIRAAQPSPDNFQVVKFPGDMGAPDFLIKRLPKNIPPIVRLQLGEGRPDDLEILMGSVDVPASRGRSGFKILEDHASPVNSDLVLIAGPSVNLIDQDNVLHALRHLEMIDTAVAVCGPVAKLDGEIVRGAGVYTGPDILVDPYMGKSFFQRGEEMLSALKPVCVGALNLDLLLVRKNFLIDAMAEAPVNLPLRSLGVWLGIVAERRGLHVVYEPLFRAFAEKPADLMTDTMERASVAPSVLREASSQPTRRPIRGHAAMLASRKIHSR